MNLTERPDHHAKTRRILSRPSLSGSLLGWLVLAVTCLTASAETYQVNVFDYFFEPFQLSIQTGDTIEWTAYGYGHTVLSDTRVFDSSSVWGSSIPALRSFKFTFHQPGVYPYYSLEYGGPEGQGMAATLSVTGAVTNQIPAAPMNSFPAGGSSNQPIRVELRGSTFADGDPGDVHVASEWVVRRAADNQLVYDSGEVVEDGGLSASKTNRFLPNQLLQHGTDYQWQVRYKDSFGAWSPYSVATGFSTLRPTLNEFRQAGSVILVWPTNSAGFALESTANELSGPWTPVGSTPQMLGGQNVVTNNATAPLRIYRLRKNP